MARMWRAKCKARKGYGKESSLTISVYTNTSSLQVSVGWWAFTLPKSTNQVTSPCRSLKYRPIRTLATLRDHNSLVPPQKGTGGNGLSLPVPYSPVGECHRRKSSPSIVPHTPHAKTPANQQGFRRISGINIGSRDPDAFLALI